MRQLLFVLLLAGLLPGAGCTCKSSEPESEPPASAPPTPRLRTSVTGPEEIGIAICDYYLEKFEACIATRAPEPGRPAMLKGLKETRAAWRNAARTEMGRSQLPAACKTALDMAKQAMAAHRCEW